MQQKLAVSKPDSLDFGRGISADLEFVRAVIAEVLDYEAEKNPALAPVLRAQKRVSGKMLRPTLLLLGQAIGQDFTGQPGPGEPARSRSTTPSGSRSTASTADFVKKIRGILDFGGTRRAGKAFDEWKETASRTSGPANRFYLMAAAVEVLHLASLIHDDVLDRSKFRRGLPAVWQQAGTTEAVLLGDLLFGDCFALMSYSGNPDTGKVMSGMVRSMIRSELLQLDAKREAGAVLTNPGRRGYLRIIAGKTAGFFSLCLSAGAYEAGAPEAVLEKLRRIGYSIGMAFQIQDDILDFCGSPDLVGKPLGRDLKDGQITLPLIVALEAAGKGAPPPDLPGQIERYWSGDEALLPQITAATAELGGFRMAAEIAEAYLERARRDLAAIGGTGATAEAGQGIRSLIDFLAHRNF